MTYILVAMLVVTALLLPLDAAARDRDRGRRWRSSEDPTPTEVVEAEAPPLDGALSPNDADPSPPEEPGLAGEPAPDVPGKAVVDEDPPEEVTEAPTEVPPTPTEIPPTELPPTVEPLPTEEVIWVNTDSLAVVMPASGVPLAPGSAEQIVVRYQVTTPRVSTVVYAELAGDAAGWMVSSPALGDADGSATTAMWVEAGTLAPGNAFELPIVVTAPVGVAVDQVVELHIWSEVSTGAGGEAGVAWPGLSGAVFTVVAPAPDIAEPPADVPVEPDVVVDEGPGDSPAEVPEAVVATPGVGEDGEQGDETQADAPVEEPEEGADVPAASPEPDVDAPSAEIVADTVAVAGESDLEIGAGESIELALTYGVTTERAGTRVQIALVDGDGEAVEGWGLDPAGPIEDATALAPETSFPVAVTLTAPAQLESPQAVQVVAWSEIATVDGVVEGLERQVVATVAVAASPAEPGIGCKPGEVVNTFTCEIDPGRSDALSASLAVAGPSGWTFTGDGVALDQAGRVDLAAAGVDIAVPGSVQVAAEVPEGCPDPAAGLTATVSLAYAYDDGETATAEAALELQGSEPGGDVPSLSMAPLDFGTLVRDGDAWGTARAVGTIDVSRDGCGGPGDVDVQVEVIGAEPGLQPVITGVTASGAGIASRHASGSASEGPVAVATVSSGFQGTGQVEVAFSLTPDGDVASGEHAMQIRISTSRAP